MRAAEAEEDNNKLEHLDAVICGACKTIYTALEDMMFPIRDVPCPLCGKRLRWII